MSTVERRYYHSQSIIRKRKRKAVTNIACKIYLSSTTYQDSIPNLDNALYPTIVLCLDLMTLGRDEKEVFMTGLS